MLHVFPSSTSDLFTVTIYKDPSGYIITLKFIHMHMSAKAACMHAHVRECTMHVLINHYKKYSFR